VLRLGVHLIVMHAAVGSTAWRAVALQLLLLLLLLLLPTSSNFAVANCPTPPVAPATSTVLPGSCYITHPRQAHIGRGDHIVTRLR
jgi:hypothetical protein